MTCLGRRPRSDHPEMERRRRAGLLPSTRSMPPHLPLLLAAAAAAVALLPAVAEAQKYDALLRQALIASLSIDKVPASAAAAATPPPQIQQQSLGSPGSSGVHGAAASSAAVADDVVPHYMLDLYRRHRSGLALKDGTNTIRCLRGKRGSQFRPDLVVFNVASVADPSTVVRAELHFTRRKMGAIKEQAFHVTFYDVRDAPSSADMTSTDTLGYSQISRGWQALDITPAVVRSVRRAASDGYQLGVTLAPLGGGGAAAAASPLSTYRSDVLQSLTKAHHSRPYILVYTNETANISEDHVYSRLRARGYGGIREETGSMIDPVRGLNQQQRQRTSDDVDAAKRIFFLRHRRDLSDNEIPGDPDVSRRRMTTAAVAVRSRPADRAGAGVPTVTTPTTSFRPKDLPGGGVSSSSGGRGGNGAEQLIPWPRPGKADGSATSGGSSSAAAGRCGRRPLALDFRDIGWDSWIIEPKSFEAAYCAGSCSFPDALSLNPTNHATLQSLLHAVGVRSDVPAPCCAPDKLSSLTVLYFDPRKNIVLKTYPDMSAESCACR